MKKLLTILLTISFLLLPISYTSAQEENINEEVIEQSNEEEETETLADQLEKETIEDIQPEPVSFLTILGAILIPCIFIIIAYLILKFFKF
jgi:hypothetical protein